MTPKRKVAGKIPRKDPFRYRYGGSFGPVPGNSKHRRHKEIDDDLSIVGLTSKHCDTLIKTGQLLKIRVAAQKVREALVS